MNPFAAAQVHTLVENIRLLEVLVTAPLGLYSDIRMLRQALPMEEAADLSRSETGQRRIAYRAMTDVPGRLALQAIEQIEVSLDILDGVDLAGDAGPRPEWTSQARRVMARARQKVGSDLRSGAASKIEGLYVIVDPEATNGRPVADVAEAALRGGARVIQLRDKSNNKDDVLAVSRQLKSVCDDHGALFIMNDDADIALTCDAHGLHVGQTDLPVSEARRTLTRHQIVGTSNNGVDEAMQSTSNGADYLAVGAVFATTTMGKSGRTSLGVEMLSKVKDLVSQPIVAIGGINAGNIAEVVRAGADCVCVVSAVTFADDPEAATRELVEAMHGAR